MDPAVKAYLDNLTAKMEANTTVTNRLDDLENWRPDLERRVSDLSDVVTALQQARPSPTTDTSDGAPPQRPIAPPPALHNTSMGVTGGNKDDPQGSKDHGDFNLQ